LSPAAINSKPSQRIPNREALEQIAKETGDPGLIERLQDDRKEAEARAFVATHRSYYRSDQNYEAIREYVDEHGLTFNKDNLATAYKSLSRAGQLEVDPATPRPLTDHTLRSIALQAASGDVEGAVARYLQLRLPETASELWMYSTSLQEALDTIAAPEYKRRAVVSGCGIQVALCFQSHPPVPIFASSGLGGDGSFLA
jgi:hypothetical protein